MPPIPSRGLEDDVALRGVKVAHGQRVARDQGGGGELREFEDGELLGVVAQRARPVEDTCAFVLGALQQMGGVEELAVEGRVLAHEHGVEVAQGRDALLWRQRAFVEPVLFVAGQPDAPHRGRHAGGRQPAQVPGLTGCQGVAAALRLAHHGVGAVLVGLEGFQRIGDEKQVHGACVVRAGGKSLTNRLPGP
jgi:hypothetical protein